MAHPNFRNSLLQDGESEPTIVTVFVHDVAAPEKQSLPSKEPGSDKIHPMEQAEERERRRATGATGEESSQVRATRCTKPQTPSLVVILHLFLALAVLACVTHLLQEASSDHIYATSRYIGKFSLRHTEKVDDRQVTKKVLRHLRGTPRVGREYTLCRSSIVARTDVRTRLPSRDHKDAAKPLRSEREVRETPKKRIQVFKWRPNASMSSSRICSTQGGVCWTMPLCVKRKSFPLVLV